MPRKELSDEIQEHILSEGDAGSAKRHAYSFYRDVIGLTDEEIAGACGADAVPPKEKK